MMKDIAVDYLGGSGFLVTIGETALLFDASEHGPDKRILPEKSALADFKKLYVFISHRHSDHFSETVYEHQQYLDILMGSNLVSEEETEETEETEEPEETEEAN